MTMWGKAIVIGECMEVFHDGFHDDSMMVDDVIHPDIKGGFQLAMGPQMVYFMGNPHRKLG